MQTINKTNTKKNTSFFIHILEFNHVLPFTEELEKIKLPNNNGSSFSLQYQTSIIAWSI